MVGVEIDHQLGPFAAPRLRHASALDDAEPLDDEIGGVVEDRPVAGRHLLLVRIVQALIGSASCALLALAGVRLFSRRTGLIAGLMLVRGESLSTGMSQYLEDQLAATKNIVVKLNGLALAGSA